LDALDGVDVVTVLSRRGFPRTPQPAGGEDPSPPADGRFGQHVGYGLDMTSAHVIDEIGSRLSRVAPANSRVVLFGSHAREQVRDDSDYDVLVIEPDVENVATEAVRLRRELRDLGVPIDVVVVDRDRARRRAAVRGTMVERALREGRVLADT